METKPKDYENGHVLSSVKKKTKEIADLKKEAGQKYHKAKNNIKQVIADIKATGGEFDYEKVETTVTDLFDLITQNDNAFFYLTKEIFSYDDYLYHHSINVCTIGTAILKKYNELFGGLAGSFSSKELFQISIGYFLHDVGKVLLPDHIVNKKGRLTEQEFAVVKTHSFEKGLLILKKNMIHTPIIRDVVRYHHSAIAKDEPNCYPAEIAPEKLSVPVKICKLADIYDAMTSKRCYKDAFNPVGVVTEIVRKYAQKDETLQYALHAFVKAIGIYPAGSVVHLTNRQLGYVLDNEGPLVIPFTDTAGKPLDGALVPFNLAEENAKKKGLAIDMEKPLIAPFQAYDLFPERLKRVIAA